jgi:hypothetical protein
MLPCLSNQVVITMICQTMPMSGIYHHGLHLLLLSFFHVCRRA